jgi:hypothetical protein
VIEEVFDEEEVVERDWAVVLFAGVAEEEEDCCTEEGRGAGGGEEKRSIGFTEESPPVSPV